MATTSAQASAGSASPVQGQTGHPLLTSPPPYHIDQESIWGEEYQSITAHPSCRQVSFEELRVYDYANNRSGAARQSTGTDFMLPTEGLVSIHMPQGQWPSLSRRTNANQAVNYGASIVTFRVGADSPIEFSIHEALVVSRSPFVRMSLDGDWKEAQRRVIPLPDDAPEIFELYQHWIYSGNIYSHHPGDAAKLAKEFETLVKAYILGEKFMDTGFKDAVISCIIDRMHFDHTFDIRLSGLVYDNTPPGSPLRRLWRDIYTWSGRPSWLDESLLESIHPDLSHDVSRLVLGFSNGQRLALAPFVGNACSYHEHAGGICAGGIRRIF